MPQFYTLLTDTGQAKIANAIALGQTIDITELAIGDGNGSLPEPNSSATALVNEVRRAPINTSTTDPDNPSWIIVEQVLPPDVGGWTICEIGIYDLDGDLIGVGNYPETYKPVLAEGSSRTQTVRFVLEVSDTSAVTLKVDPSVVLATREYADRQRAEHEQDSDAHTDDQIPLCATVDQVPEANNVAEALAALGAFAGDGYQNIAVFDTAGTTEWTVPQVLQDGYRKAHVTVIGGGGGGGGTSATGSSAEGASAGGGGGGGMAVGLVSLTDVDSVKITVGGSGAGGLAGNNDGSAGGSSSFGAHLTATGGGGGSGSDATGGTSRNFGGSGGAAAGGDVNAQGSDGSVGIVASSVMIPLGIGGGSLLGGFTRAPINSSGLTGKSYGAGGSGAAANAGSSAYPGGNGSNGIVTVRW